MLTIGNKMGEENCTLTRIYYFSAAHRLHNDKFSDKKNKKIFGKCNNPKGHGHDYYVELSVKGAISPDTGMIINIEDLDGVASKIIDKLDHKRLDVEIEYFTKVNASGENIAKYLWKRFIDEIPSPAFLFHIRLWETSENFFDYKE